MKGRDGRSEQKKTCRNKQFYRKKSQIKNNILQGVLIASRWKEVPSIDKIISHNLDRRVGNDPHSLLRTAKEAGMWWRRAAHHNLSISGPAGSKSCPSATHKTDDDECSWKNLFRGLPLLLCVLWSLFYELPVVLSCVLYRCVCGTDGNLRGMCLRRGI